METKSADLVILGAGPGGYVAAIRGAQLGLETIVVEDGQVGGVCLNWGCIPSKALIHAADTLHVLRADAAEMGIRGVEGASLDAGAMQEWKGGIVKKLVTGVKTLFKGNGVTLVNGRGTLLSLTEVEVATKDGPVRVTARKGVILATGGSPIDLPALPRDGETVIGAREAVSLGRIPGRVAVIGGGVIGLELGTVLRKLGAEVTVVELLPTILPGMDPDVVSAVARRLRQLKMEVLTSARAEAVERRGQGAALTVTREGEARTIEVDKVLVAVGMRPVATGIGLEALGVRTDKRGFVETDERCCTSVPGVYAVGDLAGQPMLAHKASFEGEIAAEAIAGHGERTRKKAIPSAVFTDPEVGSVGLTEPDAVAAGHEVKVGRFFFAASGKAMALQETGGLAKVVADARTGRILGAHIAGPHASDLLAEAALAVELGLEPRRVGEIVHAHPTLSEVLCEAMLAVTGEAIHAVRK
ncbi:MAG: dihydrolipoyl dehydrogenase [Deltaproteobacteria bacterium]|nr:dihydrolipoyl dehydrogenase [Deltaproteobacteria bacterium]